MKSLTVLRILLVCVCAAHVGIGVSVNLFPKMLPVLAGCYGATVNWTPEFTYILKPLGAFMSVLGLLAAWAAVNPLRNRVIIYAVVLLFVLRSVQRLLLAQEIADVFAIVPGRNLVAMAFFLALGAALVVFERLATKEASQPSPTGEATESSSS